MEKKLKIIDGNHAAAECMSLVEPDVIAAYPITPTTYIMEAFSKYQADAKVKTELVLVESEHAAMSACVGVTAGGGRSMTATASQGLILMHEVLFNASGMRLPIVLFVGNRTVGAPLSIHGDHSDVMATRDSGFIQFFADSAQEVLDLGIQAVRIAENKKVSTPVAVNFDGFDVTHMVQNVTSYSREDVQKFVGEYQANFPLFNLEKPVSYGGFDKPDYLMEHKRSQEEGMNNAPEVIRAVGKEFTKKFQGENYESPVEIYGDPQAEKIIVVLGSASKTCRGAIKENEAVLKIRLFRPFPKDEILEALQGRKQVAILDRVAPSGAFGGPLFAEIRNALFGTKEDLPKICNFIFGLGGREFSVSDASDILQNLDKFKDGEVKWIGVRE